MAHEIVVILIVSLFVLAAISLVTMRIMRTGPFVHSKEWTWKNSVKKQKKKKVNRIEPRKIIPLNSRNQTVTQTQTFIETSRGLLRVVEEVEGESSDTINHDKQAIEVRKFRRFSRLDSGNAKTDKKEVKPAITEDKPCDDDFRSDSAKSLETSPSKSDMISESDDEKVKPTEESIGQIEGRLTAFSPDFLVNQESDFHIVK